MTGFQRTIATLGGLAGILALALGIGGAGGAGPLMIAGSLVLAAVGLRHHLGLMPQARIDLVASIAGMLLLLSVLDGEMASASWPFLVGCWLIGWLAVEKSLAARGLSQAYSSLISLAVPVFSAPGSSLCGRS